MIVKKHGKRDTSNAYVLEALEVYAPYRELCLDLVIAKRRRYMKPMIITTVVSTVLAFFTNIPELFMFSMFMVFLTAFFVLRIMMTDDNSLAVKTSESGKDLTHVPYPLTDSNMTEAIHKTENIYGPPRTIVGSPVFQENPLKTPVVRDGKSLVGAFVEVELEDVLQPTEYFLMLEDGQTVKVDRDTFMDTTQYMYPDENGVKQYIPILTGREDSILWGLLGDTQSSIAYAGRQKNDKKRVIALRKAIQDSEELLTFLALQNIMNT